MGKIYKVEVHGMGSEKMVVDLCNTEEQMKSMTVLQLKEKILERFPEYAAEDLCLIFINKRLDGDTTLLSSYGVQHMSVIHSVLKMEGGGSERNRDKH